MTQDKLKDEVSPLIAGVKGNAKSLWQIQGHIERPSQEIPVIYDVDVAVVGAGVAGLIAALAAGRYGAKTLIVEAFSSLGGNMGVGMFAGGSLHLALQHPEAFPNGLGGIPAEFNARVVGQEDRNVGSDYFKDSQSVSYVATKMMEEEGVDILLSSVVSGVVKEGDAVRGLFVETKSGTLAIRSKVVVDCTGTADVADRAGAPVIERPANPSAGTFFAIAGVDWDIYQRELAARGALSEEENAWLQSHAPGAAAFMPWVREAWDTGEFRIVDTVDDFATLEVTFKAPKGDPPLARVRTRVNGNYHPGDGLALSRIDQKMRVYIYEFVEFLHRRVPGFENAYLHVVSPFTHARGGKSIDSVRMVAPEDVEDAARFDDVVYIYYDDKKVADCDIPYRMLLPQKMDGLLAAGKSAMKRGPQFRVRYSCQLMGQAAGVAAALAVKHGVEPREIDVKELQKILHQLGSEMGSEDRLRELGIV